METLAIQVPDALLLQSGASRESLLRESQFWLALRFFQNGRLTSGQAAAMCSLNRVDFLFEAGRHRVPVADLDAEELDREIQAGRAI
jgi:predicted HTH domain antitoxin